MKHLFRLLALAAIAVLAASHVRAADLSITGTAVIPSASAVIVQSTAGEAITRGQLVYKKASDRKIYKADCDSATAEVRDVVGIAVTDSSAGGPIAYVTEDPDLAIAASGLTNGTIYLLSATAGGLAPAADATTGWRVTVVAVAKSATTIAFRAATLRSATAL
jgi:hypothetical protein